MENETSSTNHNPIPPMNYGAELPNSQVILILGIASIPLACLCSLVGVILGIVALVMGNNALKMYNASPSDYSQSSFNNVKNGRLCGIIGLALSILFFVISIIYYVVIGGAALMQGMNGGGF